MAYWVKRILLKSGKIVTERELRPDENASEGPAPAVGEKLTVTCRGRAFETRVIFGEVGREEHLHLTSLFHLRVEELSDDARVISSESDATV